MVIVDYLRKYSSDARNRWSDSTDKICRNYLIKNIARAG